MEDLREILEEFKECLEDCGYDAFYLFENTDEAIDGFLKQRGD